MPAMTRAAKRARLMDVRNQALGLVLQTSEFLYWYEAVKLGETCQDMYHIWQENKNLLCEPVLFTLTNKLKISTNICRNCEKVAFPASQRLCQCNNDTGINDDNSDYEDGDGQDTPLAFLDPRFHEEVFSTLSTWHKCQALVEFAARMVGNFQSNFDFHNPSNMDGLPVAYHLEWTTVCFRYMARVMPRRLAFLINAIVANGAQYTLYGGTPIHRFSHAFADTIIFDPYVGPSTEFELMIIHTVAIPTNRILEEYIHKERYADIWQSLGPILTRKLDFLAPFFNAHDGSARIPTDLEPLEDDAEEDYDY